MNSFHKPTKVRSKKLTREAKGQNCKLRTPHCNGRSETVVFCHAPSKYKGTATKSDDFWGADGCSSCHQFLDEECDPDVARQYWMPAIYETLKDRFNKRILRVD